jgi:hypothetical protein
MLRELFDHLKELGYDPATVPDKDLFPAYLKSMQWKPDYLSAMTFASWKTSEYGFLTSFDPYAPSSTAGGWTTFMAGLAQVSVMLKRFSDFIQALLPAIFDNEVIFRIRKACGAISGFNDLLLTFDPKKWDKWRPSTARDDNAWDQTNAQRVQPAIKPDSWKVDSTKTAAKLTSKDGPFDISGFADPVMKIRDVKNGTQTTADFSQFFTAARLKITVGAQVTSCSIATGSANTSVSVDGQTVRYDASTQTWGSWPAGFTLVNQSGTRILSKNGNFFTITGAQGVTVTDLTFASGSATLVVNGTSRAISTLASVNATTAAARATALAALVNANPDICTASASGATVTITSLTPGVSSSVSLSATLPAHQTLGLTGVATGSGPTAITAEQLRTAIAGKGNYTATTSGATVEVKHNTEGRDSYLEFSGPIATVFFGADPSSKSGTDAFDAMGQFKGVMTSLDSWLSGSAIQAMARPVFELVDQVIEVWSKVEGVFKEIDAFIQPRGSKAAVGVIAGDGGITLGTTGSITGTGHSITLIAGGKAEDEKANRDKYVLGEHLFAALDHINTKFTEWWCKMWGTWDPKPAAPRGDFKVISSGTINMVAQDPIRMLSKSQVQIVSASVDVHAKETVTIASHTASVELRGPAIAIGCSKAGAGAEPSKQQETKDVVVDATTGHIWLHTTSYGAWLDEAAKKIQLGARSGTTRNVDASAALVEIDGNKKSVSVRSENSGIKVEKGIWLHSGNKIQLVANKKKDIECAGGSVKIFGDIDVGGALTVKGVPVATAPEVQAVVDTLTPKINALELKANTLEAQARLVATAIERIDASIATLRDQVAPLVPLPAAIAASQAAQDEAIAAANQARLALQRQLEGLEAQHADTRSRLNALGARAALERLANR